MGKNVVEELLVALGMENDVQSFQEGSRLFDSVRAKALLFGGAVAGVAYGVNRMVMNFADAKDQLGKFQEVTGASSQFVDALGFALEKEGGRAEDAFGSVKRVLDLLRDIELGDINGYTDALMAGFDFQSVGQAKNLADAYERIARATSGMDVETRRRALTELGFSDSEIRLFAGGTDQMREFFAQAARLAPVTDEMTSNAADLKDATADLTKAITGITDELSVRMAPRFAAFSRQLADFLADNRGMVGDTYDSLVDQTAAEIEGINQWLDALGNGDLEKALELTTGGVRYLFTGDSKPAPAPEGFWDYSADDQLGAMPPPGDASTSVRTTTEYNIQVDARGATNPREVEIRVENALMKALGRAAERSVENTEVPYR